MTQKLAPLLDPYRLQRDIDAFVKEPPIFGKSILIHYSKDDGWSLEELSIVQRIYYLALSLFQGISVPLLNYQTLSDHIHLLEKEDLASDSVKRITRDLGIGLIAPQSKSQPIAAAKMRTVSPFSDKPLRQEKVQPPPNPPAKADGIRITGIPNLGGSSCWMNASLQVLFHSQVFRKALSSSTTTLETPQGRLCLALKECMAAYDRGQVSHDLAEKVRRALYDYIPDRFADSMTKQQCASIALHGFLTAVGVEFSIPPVYLDDGANFISNLTNTFLAAPLERAPPLLVVNMETGQAFNFWNLILGLRPNAEMQPPREIDLSHIFNTGNHCYLLLGVANHYGASASGGHWVAVLPTTSGNTEISDTSTYPCDTISTFHSLIIYERLEP